MLQLYKNALIENEKMYIMTVMFGEIWHYLAHYLPFLWSTLMHRYGALFAKWTTFLHYLSDFDNTLYFGPLGDSRMLNGRKKVSESLDV